MPIHINEKPEAGCINDTSASGCNNQLWKC
jgi:hypothetical protein